MFARWVVTAAGVRGMKLMEDDQVVSLIVPSNEGDILTVTENGFGKAYYSGRVPG